MQTDKSNQAALMMAVSIPLAYFALRAIPGTRYQAPMIAFCLTLFGGAFMAGWKTMAGRSRVLGILSLVAFTVAGSVAVFFRHLWGPFNEYQLLAVLLAGLVIGWLLILLNFGQRS
ncbi:MAG: hypothetical protein AB1331_06010 [Bacillota bacterium]